jgi:hypothetical protein
MQQGSGASAVMTDEQILGLDPVPGASGAADAAAVSPAGTQGDSTRSGAQGAPAGNGAESQALSDLGANVPEAVPSAAPSAAPSAPAGESDPAWLRALESQPQAGPEAAAEARRWRAAASDAAQLDAAYFNADPGAQTGLASRLYDTDPAAFRSMLAAGARMLSERDPQGLAELARQLGATPEAARTAAKSLGQAARPEAQNSVQDNYAAGSTRARYSGVQGNAGAFPAEAYRSFQSATNDEVGRSVHDAIDTTLHSTLPEGIADGARRRIGEDIFQEVHATLAADRDLARQIGEVLRGWRFDAASRQQVSTLVAGRARTVLPEVARRVVAEWTSSVLASDRAKSARIAAAASRRDITGGRLPEPVPTSALRPRDIDYGRLSDEQILEL